MTNEHTEGLPALAQGKELRYLEHNGEVVFTAEEVGRHLGYSSPRESVNHLFNKNRNELKHYSSVTKTITEAGVRPTRVFTEEGVYLLSMLARTNKAKAFRARVALLLRDLRQRRIDQARAAGRLEAVKVFKSLTPKQREIMERTVKYKRMGLSYLEIAKLLECSKDTAGRTIRKARALGMEV